MADLMAALEEGGVAAPGPIEQRWSASSSADMSPASSPDNMDVVHSWVGIIMYLPEDEQEQRAQITQRSAISCDCPAEFVAGSHRGLRQGRRENTRLQMRRVVPGAAILLRKQDTGQLLLCVFASSRLCVQLQRVRGPGGEQALAQVQGRAALGQAGGGQDGEGRSQGIAGGEIPGGQIQCGTGSAGPQKYTEQRADGCCVSSRPVVAKQFSSFLEFFVLLILGHSVAING